MGMYTNLRLKVYVKEQYRNMINQINDGADWSEFVTQFPFLTRYAKLGRAEFIPRGGSSYMPYQWNDGSKATEGFDTHIDLGTGYWTFQCSLKDYENEIECFFKDVLPVLITSSEHIESYYEEWDESKFYELEDGAIKLKSESFKTYRYN